MGFKACRGLCSWGGEGLICLCARREAACFGFACAGDQYYVRVLSDSTRVDFVSSLW